MKKLIFICLSIFICLGLVTSYIDSARVRNGVEPRFVIKFVSNDNNNFNTYLKNKVCSSTPTSDSAAKDCLVSETATDGDYTNATVLSQSDYGTPTMYSATSYSSTSGTAVDNVFTYSGNEWSTTAANMTSNTYYHIQSKRKLIPMTPAFVALRHPLAGGGMFLPLIPQISS